MVRNTETYKDIRMKTGIELITEERKEQVKKHGWSSEHDKQHEGGQLAYAAAQCVSPQVIYQKEEYANATHFVVLHYSGWDLPTKYNGNVLKDNIDCTKQERIHQLKVAGALCGAEIDRLNNSE